MTLRVRFTYKYPIQATTKAELYRHTQPFTKDNVFNVATLVDNDSGSKILNDTNVNPNATYYYMIVAIRSQPNSSGNGVYSYTDCFKVPATTGYIYRQAKNAIQLKVSGYEDYNDNHSYVLNGVTYNQTNDWSGPLWFKVDYNYYSEGVHRINGFLNTSFYTNGGMTVPLTVLSIKDLIFQGNANIVTDVGDNNSNPSVSIKPTGVSFNLQITDSGGVGVIHEDSNGGDRKTFNAINGMMIQDSYGYLINARRNIIEITEGVISIGGNSLFGNNLPADLVFPSTLRTIEEASINSPGAKRIITNKGLTKLPDATFSGAVEFVDLSETINNVDMAFRESSDMVVISRNPVPPTIKAGDIFGNGQFTTSFGPDPIVYVPDALLSTYQADAKWGLLNPKALSTRP